jgi:hypothetical protein
MKAGGLTSPQRKGSPTGRVLIFKPGEKLSDADVEGFRAFITDEARFLQQNQSGAVK